MLNSMTGFGRACGQVAGQSVVVEVRCLNHRFQDIRVQLPAGWERLEMVLAGHLRSWLGRGRVECQVRALATGAGRSQPRLDAERARQYLEVYRQLATLMWKDSGQEQVPDLALLAAAEGVVVLEEQAPDEQAAGQQLLQLLEQALAEAGAMRRSEGERLQRLLAKMHRQCQELVGNIRRRVPAELQLLQQRLRERVEKLAGGVALEPQRLAQELALLAERADVTEELDRLDSHLGRFAELLEQQQPVGRQLDFLLQELNREANTLAAKVQSAPVIDLAVEVKTIIERMREQVQNVE